MICCRLMAIDISCCICPIIFCTALFSDLKSDIAFWVAENASVSFSMPYVLPFMSKSLCRMSRLLPADSASCRSERRSRVCYMCIKPAAALDFRLYDVYGVVMQSKVLHTRSGFRFGYNLVISKRQCLYGSVVFFSNLAKYGRCGCCRGIECFCCVCRLRFDYDLLLR